MRFSRGVAYLNPQGAGAPPAGQGTAEAGAQEADLVAQAFSALQARKEGTSAGLVRQQSRLEAMQQVMKKKALTGVWPGKKTDHLCTCGVQPFSKEITALCNKTQSVLPVVQVHISVCTL